MVDPTLTETIAAAFAVVIFFILIVGLVTTLVHRLREIGQARTSSSADVDVKILMSGDVNVNRDPTIPDSPYAGVNEARELLQRRR